MQPDSDGAILSSYIVGLINKGNWRKPDDWGALAAWALGISRLIDYFETDPDVDATKIAVKGRSRYGKATLVTAMLDQRSRCLHQLRRRQHPRNLTVMPEPGRT